MEWNLEDEYRRIIAGKGGRPKTVRPEPTGRATDGVERKPIYGNNIAWQPKKYKPCATYVDGELTKLRLSSTLLKRLYYKGEPRQDTCPKKEYHHILKADIRQPPSEIMMRGLLFEAICFRDKEAEEYYAEKLTLNNGRRSIHTDRIYEQAQMFEMVAGKYGLTIDNTQVHLHGGLHMPKFPDIEFSLEGTADIVTEIHATGFDYAVAVVDLKLTMDRNSEFGEFAWGAPQFMDHTQAILYSYLANVPAAYLVFDYKARDRGHKLIPVATRAMFPDYPKDERLVEHYNVARDRQTDLRVLVKDVVHTIMRWDAEGYEPKPSYEACKNCLLSPVNNLGDGPTCSAATYTEIT